ncbi:MAG: hypothetical protein ACOX2M_09195 [Fastidiosipilaceae bacterium]
MTTPKIIIMTASITDDIDAIVKKLSENVPSIISGTKDGKIEVLEQMDLIGILMIIKITHAVKKMDEQLNRMDGDRNG